MARRFAPSILVVPIFVLLIAPICVFAQWKEFYDKEPLLGVSVHGILLEKVKMWNPKKKTRATVKAVFSCSTLDPSYMSFSMFIDRDSQFEVDPQEGPFNDVSALFVLSSKKEEIKRDGFFAKVSYWKKGWTKGQGHRHLTIKPELVKRLLKSDRYDHLTIGFINRWSGEGVTIDMPLKGVYVKARLAHNRCILAKY